ncbi:helix-turn-helix domain-containing protein [Micromonospora sp. NBC_01699]|uniref:helix-turn-helix domain-containing protein n=1 Tax=Micromonospora sp. NBC_01699 TaxID=2975984 RepID=UPI002E367607|nr:helix-turn-helix domain-containing protein [Micromonospora sp. NBC_01699]
MHGNTHSCSPVSGTTDEQIAYTVKHAAKVMDLGERTIWSLVGSGEIESFKVGDSRRISRDALLAYVQKQHEEAKAAARELVNRSASPGRAPHRYPSGEGSTNLREIAAAPGPWPVTVEARSASIAREIRTKRLSSE